MALLSAISEPDPHLRREERQILLTGEVPSPKNPPPGCRFHTRCPFSAEVCKTEIPALVEIDNSHSVACHRWEELKSLNPEI